jgi:hypothetical protein
MNKSALLIVIMALTVGCKHDRFSVNVSGIQADITITRFEKDLFSTDPSSLEDSLPSWQHKYGSFLQYFSYIVKLGNVQDPGFADRLRQFATDHTNYLIYKRTMEVFPSIDTFKTALQEAFKHYRYYFPGRHIPRIYTYVSGLNQSAITGDSLLAVGLDKYLGTREKLYKQAGIYNYLIVNMHPEKLTSDCMMFWAETEFPFQDSVNNLAANMIYRGRMMYFTSAMVPDQPDTLKWGFTGKNLEYCRQNEKAMWADLIDRKFLFTTDRFTIDKFILEGPYTKDFGRESPARAVVWMGYRIVSAYMEKNPRITLPTLMAEKDYMKILNSSAYNP